MLLPLFVSSNIFAQTTPCDQLGINTNINLSTCITSPSGEILPGESFCIGFKVEDFTNVQSFQFTFSYDPTQLEFLTYFQNLGVLTGLVVIDTMNNQFIDQGLIPVIWFDANGTGNTVNDGTEIFNLCFETIGEPSDCTELGYADIQNLPTTEISYLINGEICVQEIILINDDPKSTCLEIGCNDLSIIDLGSCDAPGGPGGGSIEFSICGGTGPYDYEVFDVTNGNPGFMNSTTEFNPQVLNNLPASTWTIQVTDATGMMVSETITIGTQASLDFDVMVTDPICGNSATGEIIIENFRGGVAPYTLRSSLGFIFSDLMPGDSRSLSQLINGSYDIEVEDANGCVLMRTIDVFTSPLEFDIELDTASCFGAEDGFIRIIPRGGTPFPGGEYLMGSFPRTEYESNMPFQDIFFLDFLGQWKMEIEDANGCIIDVCTEIPFDIPSEVQISEIQSVACMGDSSGSFVATLVDPNPNLNYGYILFDDQSNPIFGFPGSTRNDTLFQLGLPAGNYFVEARAGGCVSTSQLITITEPADELELIAMPTDPSCGEDNGIAELVVLGGGGTYDFFWEDDPTNNTSVLSDLSTGTYKVVVTDDLGCSDSLNIELFDGAALDIEIVQNASLGCNNMGTGELGVNEITNTTMNPIRSYQWFMDANALGTVPTQEFTMPGLYWVEVEAGNCVAVDTIIIDPAAGITFDTLIVDPTCPTFNNGSISITNIQGGVAPYECEWNINFVGCDPTNLSPGNYMVTITDSDNCESTHEFLLDGDLVDITFDVVEIDACEGVDSGIIRIENIDGGTGPYTCTWEDPAIEAMAMNCEVDGVPPGDYNFTVTDADGCFSRGMATIGEMQADISVDIDFSNPTCGGALGSITINSFTGANPPIEFVGWSGNQMGQSLTDLDAGDYTASFRDSLGCTIDTMITLINQNDNFVLDIMSNVPDCPDGIDGSITFLNCVGCQCEWSDPSLNIQGCNLVSLSPGMYFVTVTDVSGCQALDTIDLTVPDNFQIEVPAASVMDASCFEGDDGSAMVTVIDDPRGVGVYDFFWSNGQEDFGVIDASSNTLTFGENFVVGFDGTCSDTAFFNIGFPELLEFDQMALATTMTNCFAGCDGSASLAATGGTVTSGAYSFLWDDGTDAAFRDDLCAGEYFVTIEDDNGCQIVESIFITQPDSIVIDTVSISQVSCFASDSGRIEISPNGGCGNFTYQWSDNISDSQLALGLVEGTYTVTVTDGCGCEAVQSYTLSEETNISFEPLDFSPPNCAGERVCIGIDPNSISGGSGNNYTWSINIIGPRMPIDSCVLQFPGPVTLAVFDEAGCSSSVEIDVPQPPVYDVNLGPDLVLDLGSTNAIINANLNGGTAPFTYNWNSELPFECLDPECSSISFVPTTIANFEVLVVDANGCEATDDIFVEVKAVRNVYVPNTFAPFSTAPNNRLMLMTGQGVEQVNYFRIYDRWGNLMFELEETPAPTSIDMGWDGRYGSGANADVVPGVYVYIGEVQFSDGETVQYKGSITLVR